jgi:hypothetical protein
MAGIARMGRSCCPGRRVFDADANQCGLIIVRTVEAERAQWWRKAIVNTVLTIVVYPKLERADERPPAKLTWEEFQ